MSHYKHLFTGAYVMTEKNALRHYISKARKLQKKYDKISVAIEAGYDDIKNSQELRNIEKGMKALYKESTTHINVPICYRCPKDDIGYCYFRGPRAIDENIRFSRYCFKSWIAGMERELEE